MIVFTIAAAALSGILLWAAFPPAAQADSAWIALVPIMLMIRHTAPRAATGWTWLAGLIFWVATLSWFPAIIKNGGLAQQDAAIKNPVTFDAESAELLAWFETEVERRGKKDLLG